MMIQCHVCKVVVNDPVMVSDECIDYYLCRNCFRQGMDATVRNKANIEASLSRWGGSTDLLVTIGFLLILLASAALTVYLIAR